MKIKNQFLANYALMFIISTIITFFVFLQMDFANHVISGTLLKNTYTAESLIRDNYKDIDITPVIENGGGIQVIGNNYEVVFTAGLDTISKKNLTVSEFTDFLIASKKIGTPYSYDIKYNSQNEFWLIVTFPTSIRIDFAIVHNKDAVSRDMNNVAGVILALILFYLLLLTVSTVIYSKITSFGIVNPLKKLCKSAQRMRDGDYSARTDLNMANELGELSDTFNAMAQQIENEISLRKQSEENRKQLVLDISHDLKNPLAGIMGYAELCRAKQELSKEELDSYTKIIYENSIRANNLITDLFELSKMESSEFIINKNNVDICEYMREAMGRTVPLLDQTGFSYSFDIPEKEIFVSVDTDRMDRVFQNLVHNAIHYNRKGINSALETNVTVTLSEEKDSVVIIFKDNGIGIPSELAKDIFKPFIRADSSRNSQTGGTGLGLAIVDKIVSAHGGNVSLNTGINRGCEFIIRIPKI
ncbi:MAG: HAMP domain-containing sensor histidine kinase [Eubacteriales bacterium]